MAPFSMIIIENQWKSMKSLKINEHLLKPMKTLENH